MNLFDDHPPKAAGLNISLPYIPISRWPCCCSAHCNIPKFRPVQFTNNESLPINHTKQQKYFNCKCWVEINENMIGQGGLQNGALTKQFEDVNLLPQGAELGSQITPQICTIISLIIQRCSMVKQTIWQTNRASHTKLYFNELFWPLRLWRLLEVKNTPRRPKLTMPMLPRKAFATLSLK